MTERPQPPSNAPPARAPVGRTPEEWQELLASWGERAFRSKQVFRWLHCHGQVDPEKMTDLTLELRARLATEGLALPPQVAEGLRSKDGTRKLGVGPPAGG